MVPIVRPYSFAGSLCVELQQLRYVVAVSEHRNFTRAAEACQVAQPSLSQQIIKLEKELRHPLFERLGRRVRLTDAGRAFYGRAVQILAEVDAAKKEIEAFSKEGYGRVAVGAILTVAPYFLPPLLKRFSQVMPHAEVVVYEDLTARILEQCLSGELDLGIVALPIADEQLNVEALYDDELKLVVPANHALATKRHISMQDIEREPFIRLDTVHCLGEQIVAFCLNETCQPRVVCRSSQIYTIQKLVELGRGISILPTSAAEDDRSKRRVYRSISGKKPTRTIALVTHKKRRTSPIVQALIDEIRRVSGMR